MTFPRPPPGFLKICIHIPFIGIGLVFATSLDENSSRASFFFYSRIPFHARTVNAVVTQNSEWQVMRDLRASIQLNKNVYTSRLQVYGMQRSFPIERHNYTCFSLFLPQIFCFIARGKN